MPLIIGTTAVSIDIKKCFWQIGYNLGIINKSTFELGEPYKDERNIAIGLLAKKTVVKGYFPDTNTFASGTIQQRTTPARIAIVNKAAEIMNSAKKICGNDLILWLTDCAFVMPRSAPTIEKMLSENNLGFIANKIKFLSLEDNVFTWVNLNTGVKKSIRIPRTK